MIKILCPECNSEDIAYQATIDDQEIFTCRDCEHYSLLNKLAWVEC